MEINSQEYCRVCTNRSKESMSIFDYYKFSEYYLQIFKVMIKCASVQIQKLDGYPERVCKSCIEHLCQAFSFKQLCEDSDYKFRHNLVVGHKTVFQHAYLREATKIQCAAAAVNENEIRDELSFSSVGSKIKSEYLEETVKETSSCSADIEIYEIKSEFIEEETKILESSLQNQSHEESIKMGTKSTVIFKCSEEETKIQYAETNISKEVGNEIKKFDEEENQLLEENIQASSDFVTLQNLTSELPVIQHQCEYCGKSFRCKTTLIIHTRIHTGEKPYKCEECGKYFRQQSALIEHNKIHKGIKPHKCEICNKYFQRNSALVRHNKIHTGDKPHKCEICGKCFRHNSSLITHRTIHTGVKPYKCEICSESFSNRAAFICHKRIHTGDTFQCEICNKSFPRKATLDVHSRIHTGDKPYACEICAKHFRHKTALVAHVITHTGENPYKCETCGKCFKEKGKLNIHLRIHTGEKPYKCEVCDKFFRHKATLTAHKDVHTRQESYNY